MKKNPSSKGTDDCSSDKKQPSPSLRTQLNRYKRKSEELARLNALHHRLSGTTDLASTMEAFSGWLMPLVRHALAAFQDEGRLRVYLAFADHGPGRRRDARAMQELFDQRSSLGLLGQHRKKDAYFHTWPIMCGPEDRGHFVLLRRDTAFKKKEERLVQEALAILQEPLQRALRYEELYEQARRDSLTGVANRRVFEETVGAVLESARRHQTPVTMASLDLDYFKQVNDTLGHAAGDLVLRKVARTIGGLVRGCDLLVRMGGDEFLLLLPNTAANDGLFLAERLRIAVRHVAEETRGCEQLALSVGLAQWHPDWTVEEWMQRADEALYEVKRANKAAAATMRVAKRRRQHGMPLPREEMTVSSLQDRS